MKKIIILVASVFCLTSSIADAQVQSTKPVLCFQPEKLIKELTDLGEQPIWFGVALDNKSYYTLTVNDRTNEWTLLQFDDKNACIIGLGKDNKILPSKSNKPNM